jgi:hypothetical protein
MKMLPSRPLEWSLGTTFDPTYDDANGILVRINVSTVGFLQTYQKLTEWMTWNVNTGECEMVSIDKAIQLWDNATNIVQSDEQEGGDGCEDGKQLYVF